MATQGHSLSLKHLTPRAVAEHLDRDPRLIVPVGTTEQHGPHLPLGCDTMIVERLAEDLSNEFQVLRAPTIEYGVNAPTRLDYAGAATLRRKTLHRLLNELVGSWERGGIQEFIILTAHGQDPHQEALSTVRTREARVQIVDVFSFKLTHIASSDVDLFHGGEIDTSLLLYLHGNLVDTELAEDFAPGKRAVKRYVRGKRGGIPKGSPGSLGMPSRASVTKGEQLYEAIFNRIAERVFQRSPAGVDG